MAPKIGKDNVQKGIISENAQAIIEEPIKDEAQITREKFEQYAESPVPVSSCKAPCSALGAASCPGSCPSVCPNNKDVIKEVPKEGESMDVVTECPYCKVSAGQEENADNPDEEKVKSKKTKKDKKKKK